MATINNQVGFVPTNPFLNKQGTSNSLAVGTSPQNGASSAYSYQSSPSINQFSSPSTGGTTTPSTGTSTGGNIYGLPYGTGQTTPVPSGINFSGLIPPPKSSTPIPSGGLSSSIAGAGNTQTSAIPAGYSYNASGQLTNNQGQIYQPPQNNSSPNTANGLASPQGYSGTTPNSNPYTATAPSFNGLVGGLAGIASQPTQPYTQAQNIAAQSAQGLINSAPSQNTAVQGASQQLADLDKNMADQTGIIGNSPIGLSEQGGEQGLLNQLYGSKRAALTTNVANTLQSNAQEQAALTGAGGVANQSAGNATSQQGTQQSGLSTAAGYAAPQPANPYGTYNPTTGQYEQYGGGTGGGAATAGGVGTQIQQGGQVQQMTGQQAQAQALATQLNQVITSAGINPANPGNSGPMTAYVNGALQWINNNTGDPQYQNFANLINEISSRYASILNQSGGTPTDQSTLSHNIINSLAGGSSIQQVLSQLDTNATKSIDALRGASGTNSASLGGNTFGSFF